MELKRGGRAINFLTNSARRVFARMYVRVFEKRTQHQFLLTNRGAHRSQMLKDVI